MLHYCLIFVFLPFVLLFSLFSLKPEDDSNQSCLQPHLLPLYPVLTCLHPSMPQAPEERQSPPNQAAPALCSRRLVDAGCSGCFSGDECRGCRICIRCTKACGWPRQHPRREDETGRTCCHGSGFVHLHLRCNAAVREPGPGNP